MTKRIKVGVAGAGVFGGHHCAKVADIPQAELIGVFDIDHARAVNIAKRHHAPAINDFSKLVEKADAVIIATPASAHYALAKRALECGRHVFVEKPMALDRSEAEKLIALAASHGVILQIGHQERYVADAAGLFNRLSSPVKVDCVRHTAASGRCEDVSVVLDLMIHDIDLIRQLTNAEIETVSATGAAHSVDADLVLSNGSLVSLIASRRAGAPERRMTLVYDDGVIEFDFMKRTAINTTPIPLHADFSGEDLPLAFRDPLAFGANDFIDAIAEGRRPLVTGEDGRGALDWALRIEDAAGINAKAQPAKMLERLRA